MTYKEEKTRQLGMNPGTASAKLIRDILFDFVSKAGYKCFRCGEEMSRETFSIEHKTPWLHEENAKDLFFDLDNIDYSHQICNIRAGRKIKEIKHGTRAMYSTRKCRCDICKKFKSEEHKKYRNKKTNAGMV